MLKFAVICAAVALTVGSLALNASVALAQAPAPSAQNRGAAPSAPLTGTEGLTATAWVQSSAEAKIAARQAYRLATHQLDVALRDKNWSAALEQTAPFQKLPPAVILDLDETVLDNSPYFARLVRDNAGYSDEGWNRWSAQANAAALEGAVAFLQYAARRGVQIFYISNRTSVEEATTRANLQRLGCALQEPEDHVLLWGERPDWKSDKSNRRRVVAQKYRVLLLVGDDLNDFVSARSLTLAQRANLYNTYAERWGERWILLSNPLYGSWEGAIYGFKSDVSPQEMLRLKYGVLQYREPTMPTTPARATPIP